MRVLAGDVGGTKTLLCIAEHRGGEAKILRQQRFENASYRSFNEILRAFVDGDAAADLASACFAVAGPVRGTAQQQHVDVTNLPWGLDNLKLARDFGIARVRIINDFAAIGYGIASLSDDDVLTLQQGEPVPHAPRAVIGAGTGLGQAILVWQADHYEVIPTEGGHANFAPADELQAQLVRELMRELGHVSWETILSGSGLVRLYKFLRERNVAAESPGVASAMQADDAAAVITRAALESGDALANAALDLFIAIYGSQTGNLALSAGATGGVYVAGGIAPKILSRLSAGAFMRAFLSKGIMSDYVARIPVHVLKNPEIGLLGAILVAGRLSEISD